MKKTLTTKELTLKDLPPMLMMEIISTGQVAIYIGPVSPSKVQLKGPNNELFLWELNDLKIISTVKAHLETHQFEYPPIALDETGKVLRGKVGNEGVVKAGDPEEIARLNETLKGPIGDLRHEKTKGGIGDSVMDFRKIPRVHFGDKFNILQLPPEKLNEIRSMANFPQFFMANSTFRKAKVNIIPTTKHKKAGFRVKRFYTVSFSAGVDFFLVGPNDGKLYKFHEDQMEVAEEGAAIQRK